MIVNPGQLLLSFLLGLVALVVLALGLYLLYAAWRPRTIAVRTTRPAAAGRGAEIAVAVDRRQRRRKAVMVAAALAMLLWVFAGRYLVAAFYPAGAESPNLRTLTSAKLRGASGAELAVSHHGAADGPTLVFTHGWGADRRDWAYAINALGDRFRVVAWDLPGLGESSPTDGRDYSLPTLAADLDSVVSSVKGRPVILVGHSIGGMLNIEYARRFPAKMGRDVVGLVQANTTFTNPVETKKDAETSRKLQKPVYEPLLHVITWVSPLVRAAGWLGYQSGLAHLQLARQSFAGNQTWRQLDEMAKYSYRSSPDIVARGVLGMLRWDGTDVLPRIGVPTLVVSGNDDTTTLPAASDRMQRDIPSATRVAVGGAAHLGPVEQYKIYADAIASFAASTIGTPAAAR